MLITIKSYLNSIQTVIFHIHVDCCNCLQPFGNELIFSTYNENREPRKSEHVQAKLSQKAYLNLEHSDSTHNLACERDDSFLMHIFRKLNHS